MTRLASRFRHGADLEWALAFWTAEKDDTVGVGAFSKEKAMSFSFTGPCARASNINIDLRRDQPEPSLKYDAVEFEVLGQALDPGFGLLEIRGAHVDHVGLVGIAQEFGAGERPMEKKMKPKFEKLEPADLEALINYYASFK